MAQRPGVHFSDRRNLSKRPAGMLRSPSSTQPPAEWGLLFDGDGYATHRLGQVLRGLAKYLIEDYTPRSSLVITPEKLSTFYAKYRLESERIPFLDVLTSKAKDANDRFADFFDDLECQHYLVQRDSRTRPRVPALTPIGFAQLFTTCILAYPDEEFRRLEKIVAEIPLVADAVTQDGHPEWLPRSIIRSCLPARHDIKNRKLLDGAIDDLMDDLKLPSSGSRRPFPTQASFQRRVSAARTSTRPGQGHRRYSAPRLHSTEGSAPEEYDPRGGRKRFAPGTLHTIGDESAEGYEDSRHRERYRALDRGGSLLSPTEGDAKLRSNDERATQVDSHTPPGRFPRPSLLTNFGSRSQSYTQVYSQPNYPSITIPPPPIGNKASMSSTASLSSGRPRSPQREAHSTSVPNVSTSDSSSSTVIMTPSIVSSISESPSLEQGTLLDMLQHDSSTHQPTIDRDRIPSMSHDNVRKYSVGKKQRETNWTGGDSPVLEGNSSGGGSTGSVPLSTGADRVSTSTSRLERQPHRRLPSADSVLADDNKRLTWGEFLKSQKAGQRGSGGSGGSGGSSSAYQGGY
ncbi:hypothetical protein BJ170DRAFT_590215 [Xylariales sp. AK1849]|nr:hypothetical protein BJ170DRAFT_590215 [Xylariales sp. AK1849]